MKLLLFVLVLSLTSKSCEETKNIYVADHLVDCVGVAPQKCMLVKENIVDDWHNFYGNIKGFTYEVGYEYLLKVKTEIIKNPPADGSSLKYILVDVLEKNKTKKQASLNNNWKVITMKGVDSFQKNPTIKFDNKENKISGFAGCNNFFGKYETENQNLSLGEMGMTRKMCLDMSVENTFINNLKSVTHYKIESNKLVLYNKSGELLMFCETIN